ncbi:hypothetical protein C4587_00290 [Candidatus Parcubacteria bacterium]|nr:MAG: hypothetical protein C4587_00290 [Candidatus Parcubacteria bacterium]
MRKNGKRAMCGIHQRAARGGQSLVEVLISVAIGVVMIAAVATLIVAAIRLSSQAHRAQAGAGLGRELLENVRVWAERDWYSILSLSTTSANHYHLNVSSSPFSAVSGDEAVTLASTTYTRYFYVDDVGRDAAGKIVASGGSPDPSTKKITVIYQWPQSPLNTLVMQLTRWRSDVLYQTDWVGGPGQSGPASSMNSRFASSSQIDHVSTTGSFILTFP